MRISYSALETYAQCPQKYKFQEIERKKAPKSKEAVFGTAVHSALQFMFSKDPLFPSLEEVLAKFRDIVLESKHFPEHEKERFVMAGEKMLTSFHKKNPPWNFQVVDTEGHFEVALVDRIYETTHVLVGKIDRIDKLDDGSYEVIDYKTSRKLPSQDSVDNNLQLTIYQLGVKKRWPHVDAGKIKLSLYFLRAAEKFSTKRDAKSLKKAEEEVLSRIHDIEKATDEGNFPPVPSPLCDWCGYKPMCPAWRHLYKKEETPLENIEIDKTIGEFLSLKEEIDERKRRLAALTALVNDYMEAEDVSRLFAGGGSILRSLQERAGWDPDKVKELLEGDPIYQTLLTVDPKKLTAILKDLPYETQEKLKNQARVIKKFTALKVSKKKASPSEKV
ncbi:MAG: PD-(D/E)XK nuclease family protein [bacterium]|nr:PD-(D/E)XK nuclease family protein [bacterium]